MFLIKGNTVRVPNHLLKNDRYKGIKIEKQGTKYTYLNLEQYEDFLSMLQDTKFKKNDRVFWFKNGSSRIPTEINLNTVNTERIDIVTRVHLDVTQYDNILGSEIRYSTEEIGDKKRRGFAYATYLIKVEEYNLINNTKF